MALSNKINLAEINKVNVQRSNDSQRNEEENSEEDDLKYSNILNYEPKLALDGSLEQINAHEFLTFIDSLPYGYSFK